ncbi:MAG: T9SS type A sorting domain-containing protein [Chitinophagales bacterium]|nr:T9SS type A sorting domain-containing protein [Chitinophagales bacterium]
MIARTILTCLFFFLFSALYAQVCTPEWTGEGSGITPDTTQNLPPATVNTPYSATVQFKVPLRDTLSGVAISLNHLELTGVTGLSTIPSTMPFNYACNPSSCSFKADSVGCVTITGTPSAIGVYPLTIATKVYLTLGVFVPVSVGGYRITVTEGVGITPSDKSIFRVQQNVPNPAQKKTDIQVNLPASSLIEMRLFDMLGTMIYKKIVKGMPGKNTIMVDVSDFNPGIYFYVISNGENVITRQMVVD